MDKIPMIQTIYGWTKKQFAIAKMFHYEKTDGWELQRDLRGLREVIHHWECNRPDAPVMDCTQLSDDLWAAQAWNKAMEELTAWRLSPSPTSGRLESIKSRYGTT